MSFDDDERQIFRDAIRSARQEEERNKSVLADKPAQADAPSARKFSGSDAKAWWWENVKSSPFKMTPERIWAHCEAYAALRTAQQDSQLKLTRVELKQSCEERERLLATERAKVAQLERELADEKQAHKETTDEFHVAADGRDRWMERATAAESALSEARALLAELNKRWGVRSGECNTCDLPGGKHSGDCPIPKITALLAGASGAAGNGGAE